MLELILTLSLWQQVVPVTVRGTNGSYRQTVRNLNGREVPIEAVEDKVVANAPGLQIVERTIRRYDPNGRPLAPERQRIETRTAPDGNSEVATTTWRGDISGNMQLAERSLAVTRKSGENADTSVTVERPAADGRLEVVERKEQTRRTLGQGRTAESSTTQRRDVNGRWMDAVRTTREETKAGDMITANEARYEAAATGDMRLVQQTVSRTTGSSTEIDIYDTMLVGRAGNQDATPTLTRQQIVERSAVPGGTLETVSVRFVDPSAPGRLGPLRKAEQTTCKGECAPAIMK